MVCSPRAGVTTRVSLALAEAGRGLTKKALGLLNSGTGVYSLNSARIQYEIANAGHHRRVAEAFTLLPATPGCSREEPGSSSPVVCLVLVSECRCLVRFSLPWEKQPILEINPLCWPEEHVCMLPGVPRPPALPLALPRVPGKAKTPPTHTGHRAPVRDLYSPMGARRLVLAHGEPLVPLLVLVCLCPCVTLWVPSQLGASLWGQKSILGWHRMRAHPQTPNPSSGEGTCAGGAGGKGIVPKPSPTHSGQSRGWHSQHPSSPPETHRGVGEGTQGSPRGRSALCYPMGEDLPWGSTRSSGRSRPVSGTHWLPAPRQSPGGAATPLCAVVEHSSGGGRKLGVPLHAPTLGPGLNLPLEAIAAQIKVDAGVSERLVLLVHSLPAATSTCTPGPPSGPWAPLWQGPGRARGSAGPWWWSGFGVLLASPRHPGESSSCHSSLGCWCSPVAAVTGPSSPRGALPRGSSAPNHAHFSPHFRNASRRASGYVWLRGSGSDAPWGPQLQLCSILYKTSETPGAHLSGEPL